MSFKVAFTTHDAALYACKKWHYSGCVPAGKKISFGVWEDGRFIGVVIFSRGANNNIGKPYGLKQAGICELSRIALNEHKTPVSKILKYAIKLLRKSNPNLCLIVSYADTAQKHHGGIYQASNWIYSGKSKSADEYIVNGFRLHGRSMRALYGTHIGKSWIKPISGSEKHRYLFPLNKEISKLIEHLKQPYPKRPKQAMADPSAQRECNAHRAAPL